MAATMRKIREHLGARNTLLWLHALTIMVAAIGILLDRLGPKTNHDMTFQFSSCVVSIFMLSLLLGGSLYFPTLYQESTMVVMSCLMLGLLHFSAHCISLTIDRKDETAGLHSKHSTLALNLTLILLVCSQVVVSSHVLRCYGSPWPRCHSLRFFTLDTLLLPTRLTLAVFALAHTDVLNDEQDGASLPLHYAINAVSLASIFIVIENILSVYWGVPHRTMMGMGAIICSALCGVAALLVGLLPETSTTWRYSNNEELVRWLAVNFPLSLLHGVLCILRPSVVSSPPKLLKMFYQRNMGSRDSGGVTASNRRANAEETAGGSLYTRLFGHRADDSEAADVRAADPRAKLTLYELLMTSRSFLRNCIYLVLCVATLFLCLCFLSVARYDEGHASPGDNWGVVVVACSIASLLLRCLPSLAAQLVTWSHLLEPHPQEVAASVMLESVLSIVGALGTFISVRTVHHSALAYMAGIMALLIMALQLLQVNGLMSSIKATAVTANCQSASGSQLTASDCELPASSRHFSASNSELPVSSSDLPAN